MKDRASVILLFALALASTALGQTGSRAEKGKQLAQAALDALGGNNYFAMTDRVESGRVYSFYREKVSGLAKAVIYTRDLISPDATKPGDIYVRERTSYGSTRTKNTKDEAYATLFDEKAGYQVTFRGVRPIPEETFARYRDTVTRSVFYILRHRLKEPGLIMESMGSEVFENRPVDRLVFTDAENNATEVLLLASSHLPIYQVFFRRDPKTNERTQETTRWDNYRDAGHGVKWPMVTSRERDGVRIFQMFSDTVEVNKGLTDDLFLLPSGADVLPPPR